MLSDFGIILLYFITGMAFVAAGLITASLLRPHHPNPIKNSTYECGEELIGGGAWF
ncbi:MAG: NADH-quinone oxidoreductase subunit A [Candidatus Kapabacteria bacterium]|jgi:NADH-quinone oxidoreductase subunit A|nr:NADH-quinone oxidoreductase subunit A [Candidatus Kapabacteria bacterium]